MKIIWIEFKTFIQKAWIPISILLVYVITMYLLDFESCLSKLVLGIPCPGCGMTRASLALIRFDFVSAWNYNPFVFVFPFVLIVIIFRNIGFLKNVYNSKIFWSILLCFVILMFTYRMIRYYPNPPLNLNEKSLLFLILSLFQ